MIAAATLPHAVIEEAAELADGFHVEPPPLRQMAESVGINRVEREPGLPAAGLLMRGADAGLVAVIRSDDSKPRQRFSLAHEIGHALLEAHGFSSDLSCRDAQVERLCDRIAAELLLPRRLFRERGDKGRLEHALEIADRCCASATAAARRYVDIEPELVLIAWSTRARPGSTAKLRVLWPYKAPGIFVPTHATPPAELGLEDLPRGEARRRIVRLRLGSLVGDHHVEAVRLRYPNQSSNGRLPEVLSLVSMSP